MIAHLDNTTSLTEPYVIIFGNQIWILSNRDETSIEDNNVEYGIEPEPELPIKLKLPKQETEKRVTRKFHTNPFTGELPRYPRPPPGGIMTVTELKN